MNFSYNVHEPFISTLKRVVESIGVWKSAAALFSMFSVNLAGFIWSFPDYIRQTLDATIFANHVASLTIALAFLVLTWRISYVVLAEVSKISARIFVFGVMDKDEVRKKLVARIENTSLALSIILGAAAFLHSHLGFEHVRTAVVSAVLATLTLVSLTYAQALIAPKMARLVSRVTQREKSWIRKGTIVFRLWWRSAARFCSSAVYAKTPVNLTIAALLFASFLSGLLRHHYLTNTTPVLVIWHSEKPVSSILSLVGTTSSGFVFVSPRGLRDRIYVFAPFSNVRRLDSAVISEKLYSSTPS
jgi:hypothetical protein